MTVAIVITNSHADEFSGFFTLNSDDAINIWCQNSKYVFIKTIQIYILCTY